MSQGKLSAVLAVLLVLDVAASAQPRGLRRVRQVQRTSIVVTLGVANPQSHGRLREFWLNGPSGSAEFRVHLNPSLSLGGGGDMSLLYFNEAAFATRWPNVPIKTKENLFVGNVYIDAAYAPLPASIIRPFFKGQVGALFVTEAIYRQVIGNVRYTYYNVGGRTRLTLGVATGVTWAFDYNFGLIAEIKATYVHNDPAIGLLLFGRAGIQYKF